MKYIKQLLIILLICFAGELLAYFIPAPIPSSIYGMILLFLLLLLKIVKLEQVEDVSNFFASIMPLFFISPSVKLMTAWGILVDNLAGILIMVIVSTLITTAVTGLVSQLIIRLQRKKSNDINT